MHYADMESACCLCSRSLDDSTFKKKRKKLWAASCCIARGVLDELTSEVPGASSLRLAELKGPSAYLCHLCDGKLASIARHENQLRVLKAEVIITLKSALCLSSTEREIHEPLSAGQKRGSDSGADGLALTKAPRLSLDLQSSSGTQSEALMPEQPTQICPLSQQQHPVTSQEQSLPPPRVSQTQSPNVTVCECMM